MKKKIIYVLIIWMISTSYIHIYFFINLNPINRNLQQRADFFSFSHSDKTVNEENSELIYGSETEGSVTTLITIPKSRIKEILKLNIEADSKRIWCSNGEDHSPTKDLRIEIIINDKIKKIFNYSKIPKKYYPSKMVYNDLSLLKNASRIICSENLEADSSRKSIKIRLVTNHTLEKDNEIFTDYFYDDEYSITVCIGEPDTIFVITSIILFFNYYICIIVIILNINLIKFIRIIKNLIEPYLKIESKE
jgi:hypothetical protein